MKNKKQRVKKLNVIHLIAFKVKPKEKYKKSIEESYKQQT